MTDEDSSLSEKRVYADATDAMTAFVGTTNGVIRVSVSDDIVGEFSLERTGDVTDIASDNGRLAIGTPEDVLVRADGSFHETGFGPASAVGYDEDGALVAAGEGRLARYTDEWERLGTLEDVRAIDGGMAAAGSGLHRLDGTHVGLEDARDVSTAGTPLAATGSGLYYLANGWMCALEGDFAVVSSAGERGFAATSDTLYRADASETEWEETGPPVGGSVAAIACTDNVYAVTEDGTFLANAGDGWRHRSFGVSGVNGLAVV